MLDQQLTALIEKFFSGEADENEKEQIRQWYDSFDSLPLEFMEGDGDQISESMARSISAIRKRITRIQSEEIKKPALRSGRIRVFHRLSVVAAVLLLFAVGLSYFLLHRRVGQQKVLGYQHLKDDDLQQDVPPGGNKAVLTLANGQKIALDSAGNGILSLQGATRVMKLDSGQLAYNTSGKQGREILYNTVATPRGGEYRIRLPDGTMVWLNSASSIRFPTAFPGRERKVQVRGEAYFEVAKNSAKPFRITVFTQAGVKEQVVVLGTHFNIMAYDNEPFTKTTLLEGKVRVIKGIHSQVLNPGEQAQLNNQVREDEQIRLVRDVNLNEVIAWKDNNFCFDGDDIQAVMRQLELWYDVDVEIEGKITDHFTGTIPRNVSFSKVFEVLQKTGGLHYRIIDRKIIISS